MFNRYKTRKSMKKITLLALASAMFMVPTVATAQEVTYVEDPAQGYTFNKFQDNWFIEALGGAGVMMSTYDKNAKFGDRIGWKANLVVGKWFSPIVGVRVGGEFNQMKGAYKGDQLGDVLGARTEPAKNQGFYKQHFNNIGGFGDVMINLTNWWCGYKPGRVYNASFYAGAGLHWVYEREATGKGPGTGDWKHEGPSRNLSARVGLLNTFRLSEHVNLLLDLRFEEVQEHIDGFCRTWTEYPSALLGLSYKFNKTEWSAPIVPVCPTYKYTDAEGDALVARLAAADRKIADLEEQLKNCRKPAPVVQEAPKPEAPLATVYFPINVSKLVGLQKNVVNAVANVMLDENKNYELTGWADNYTGNDKINTRLRKERVATVKDVLVSKGVAADRLNTQINDGNLTSYGPKCASLDRAVTIVRK